MKVGQPLEQAPSTSSLTKDIQVTNEHRKGVHLSKFSGEIQTVTVRCHLRPTRTGKIARVDKTVCWEKSEPSKHAYSVVASVN